MSGGDYMDKRFLSPAICLVIVAGIFLSGCTGNNNNATGGNRIAVIDTSMGIIKVELYEDKVSITTENFIFPAQ